jgi:hypothetical protein
MMADADSLHNWQFLTLISPFTGLLSPLFRADECASTEVSDT